MRTFTRLLFAISAWISLMLVAALQAHGNVISVSTPIDLNTNTGQSIIAFSQQVKLPPNPFNPSTTAKYVEEFTILESVNTSRGMYISIGSASVPFGSRGYQIEIVGNTGTPVDPIIALYGYPGDTVTGWWFGTGTSQAIANGNQPYVELYNDNASGKSSGSQTLTANYSGSSLFDTVEAPYLTMFAESTWKTLFQSTKRNCWGDFPAANSGANVSSTSYLAWYMTADFVTHSSVMTTPNYLNPAFVNYAGASIPGCSVSVSTFTYAGFTYSNVNTYGGQ